MNFSLAPRNSGFCNANLRNNLLLRTIQRLKSEFSRHKLLHPELLRGFLKKMPAVLFVCFFSTLNADQQGQQRSMDFSALIMAAGYADAAYLNETEISKFTQLNNYELTLYQTIPDLQVAFFVATSKQTKKQIVAIRGTSNIENSIIDISLKLITDEQIGLRLHQGFASVAGRVYQELKPFLNKKYEIVLTGHSLGGAVAHILAMYLDEDSFDIDYVATFGQPKVTNISGANQYKHLNIIRVVTYLDLVPLSPPFDPLDINNLDIYWHAGKEIVLLTETRFSILEGVNSMLRATKFTQRSLTTENLNNHQMSVYIDQLNAREKSNELVPYKNSFNLFNLFGD